MSGTVDTAPTHGISACSSSKAPLGPRLLCPGCSIGKLPRKSGTICRDFKSARSPIAELVIPRGLNNSSSTMARYERPFGSVRRRASPNSAWFAIGE